MKTILFVLIASLSSLAFGSQPKAFEGNWARQNMPAGAENVCPETLGLKIKKGFLSGASLSVTQYGRTDKYGNFGEDGKVIGGCSSGWSPFDPDNASGCSFGMTRVDVSENQALLSNYNCSEKECVNRKETWFNKYEAQSDGSLLLSTLASGSMSAPSVNCTYTRAQ